MKLLNRPVSPSWPDNGNHSSARLLLYVLWVGLHCEPLRNTNPGLPTRPVQPSTIRKWHEIHRAEDDGDGGDPHNDIRPAASASAVRKSARHGEQPRCNRAEPMPELAR